MQQLRIMPDIIQNQTITSLSATRSVLEGAKLMAEKNVAAIIIVNDGKLSGIVTERDLTQCVLAKGLDAKKTSIGDIMTKDPDTLSPGDSALDALELMSVRNYRHLPVVENGEVVGMVSIRDLYSTVKKGLEADIRKTEAFVFGDRYGA
ncbi:MAG: CBS domain-containing protein [Rhodospirillales bacterium]|nr:CBS domain-containing protein [Rhodospirillales bacterium]